MIKLSRLVGYRFMRVLRQISVWWRQTEVTEQKAPLQATRVGVGKRENSLCKSWCQGLLVMNRDGVLRVR